MTDENRIIATRIPLPLDRHRIEYALENDQKPIRVSYDLLAFDTEMTPAELHAIAEGDVLRVGPYRVKVFECRVMWTYDYRGELYGWGSSARYWLYRATRWMDGVYRRIILTAYVWGLADCEAGYIPSWRDLKVFRRK